jgi:trehalose-6-phosphate synthase
MKAAMELAEFQKLVDELLARLTPEQRKVIGKISENGHRLLGSFRVR